MDADYGLVEPFDIDNGELAGLRPQDCFVLGVEWQMVHTILATGKPASMPLHAKNASRIKRMCIRRDRAFKVVSNGDEWVWLYVSGDDGESIQPEDGE
jgi:hypothetical protein